MCNAALQEKVFNPLLQCSETYAGETGNPNARRNACIENAWLICNSNACISQGAVGG